MQKRSEDIAEYIEAMATELAAMARRVRLPITAYMLEMAAADARNGGQIPGNGLKKPEPAGLSH